MSNSRTSYVRVRHTFPLRASVALTSSTVTRVRYHCPFTCPVTGPFSSAFFSVQRIRYTHVSFLAVRVSFEHKVLHLFRDRISVAHLYFTRFRFVLHASRLHGSITCTRFSSSVYPVNFVTRFRSHALVACMCPLQTSALLVRWRCQFQALSS